MVAVFGKYTIDRMNDGTYYVSFLDPFNNRIRIQCDNLETIVHNYVDHIYYKPINHFIVMFERAFNDNSDFGNTDEELEFLKCIPKDFPAFNYISDRNQRFIKYVEAFVSIFNRCCNQNLNVKEVLPYVNHCKEFLGE